MKQVADKSGRPVDRMRRDIQQAFQDDAKITVQILHTLLSGPLDHAGELNQAKLNRLITVGFVERHGVWGAKITPLGKDMLASQWSRRETGFRLSDTTLEIMAIVDEAPRNTIIFNPLSVLHACKAGVMTTTLDKLYLTDVGKRVLAYRRSLD